MGTIKGRCASCSPVRCSAASGLCSACGFRATLDGLSRVLKGPRPRWGAACCRPGSMLAPDNTSPLQAALHARAKRSARRTGQEPADSMQFDRINAGFKKPDLFSTNASVTGARAWNRASVGPGVTQTPIELPKRYRPIRQHHEAHRRTMKGHHEAQAPTSHSHRLSA